MVSIVKLLDPAVVVNLSGGFNFLGEYSGATTYNTGDMVGYLGSSYVAIQDTTGNLPTDTTYWQIVAEKGIQGETGEQGPAGQGVPEGGETGQVLAKTSNDDFDTEWIDQSSGGTIPLVTVLNSAKYYPERFYRTGLGSFGAQSKTPNNLKGAVYVPSEEITINEIGVEVTSGSGSGNAKIIILELSSDSDPRVFTKLFESDPIDCANTGYNSDVISGSLVRLLQGRVYVFGVLSDEALVLRDFTGGNGLYVGQSVGGVGGNNAGENYTFNWNYSDPVPDSSDSELISINNIFLGARPPVVWFKVDEVF